MNNNCNSVNQVKEFEDAFDACVGLLANSNCQQSTESDELKLSVEQCAQKFIDKARELETFFIQKRFQITSQRPEQIVIEDLNDIKNEIARKDQLIERFNEKIDHWQNNILSDNPLQQPPPSMLIGQTVPQPPPPPVNLMMNNVQQQQPPPPQHSTMNIRQRSPIQQTMMQSNNMQSPMHTSNMRPQTMMSPHPYQQAQTYTPQMMNIQANQTGQQTPNSILPPDSPAIQSPMSQPIQSPMSQPMNHQMAQMHPMQSTNYTPTTNQPVSSHLAFLEKTTSSIGS